MTRMDRNCFARQVIAGRVSIAAVGLITLLTVLGCGPTSFLVTPVGPARDLTEHVVLRESVWASQKIALIDVDGVLRNSRSQSLLGAENDNPVALFKAKLDRAAGDRKVKAIVLRINTPGGGVTASDLMYMELRRFRQTTGKPIIASMLTLATSGGYYIACAADKIYALPTTVTGSIGVIMVAPDFAGTMAKLGIRANVIKSGEMKDAGSPFREMNEKDRAVFQSMIDQMYARFLNVVAESRKDLPEEKLRELADGRVYFAPQAKKLGLIDEIGTLRQALGAAREAAGIGDSPLMVVQYARPPALRENIYAQGAGNPMQVNLLNVQLPDWLTGPAPQFLYLWAPGW